MQLKKTVALLALATTAAYAQELKVTPYGFIKASVMAADHALASYNNINLSAPTLAVARTRTVDNNSRTSFQVAQSRFGAVIQKSERVSGRFEFDIIDFSKSSPTVQMVPRVRRAVVTYKGEGFTLDIGQDWDLFSPTNPYTYDIVGLYFNAGNAGFQRQQIQYHRNLTDWQLSAAVGMAGNNPGATDGDLEIANSPTYSIRAKHTTGGWIYGYSGIYARLNYATTSNGATSATPTDAWSEAYGNNLFFERDISGGFGVKAELFQGQNLANLGTLTLARGTSGPGATSNVREWGGYVSAQANVAEGHRLFGGLGLDRIDNKGSVVAANINSTTGAVTNNATGARNNFLARVGYDYTIEKDFNWIVEVSRYETGSKLAATSYHTNVAHSLETGILWKF